MKIRTLTLAALTALAALAGPAAAQDFRFGWNPRTGDMWVDTQLSDVNRYGMRYREPFVDELVRYHGAPRDLVVELLTQRRWAPGDVYFACTLADILGRPCRYVVDYYERNHGRGWGEIAKSLGIKPGSAEFHRLKRGFVPTYDRWGRPLELDAQLQRDFPGRGKGPGHGAPGKSGTDRGNGPGRSASAAKGGADRGNGNGPDKGHGGGKGNGNGKGKGKGGH